MPGIPRIGSELHEFSKNIGILRRFPKMAGQLRNFCQKSHVNSVSLRANDFRIMVERFDVVKSDYVK